VPGPLEWALIVLAVASFGLVAFAQALFPLWAHHPPPRACGFTSPTAFTSTPFWTAQSAASARQNPTDMMETGMFHTRPRSVRRG
jgi:hypothetical protein